MCWAQQMVRHAGWPGRAKFKTSLGPYQGVQLLRVLHRFHFRRRRGVNEICEPTMTSKELDRGLAAAYSTRAFGRLHG